MKILAQNKKAYFNFEILEEFETGISLLGQEVKSIKEWGVNLSGTFVIFRKNPKKFLPEAFWIGANIPAWQPENAPGYYPQRERKILLKKSEIKYLLGKLSQKNLFLVPLKLYLKKGRIKMLLGLGKRKKLIDKKEKIKQKEIKREIERELKRI
jgi:SsrA-binding protein